MMEQKENKPKNTIYYLIILLLLLIIAILCWQLYSLKNRSNNIIIEKDIKNKVLQEELNGLIAEHDSIKVEYAQLTEKLAQKDSMISVQTAEIQKLIASQSDYKQVKKKLNYLRNITQGYVRQIDSLYKVNKILKEENVAISNKFESEKKHNVNLQKDKEQLTEKVNKASVLRATGISAIAIRMRSGEKEKVTNNASKTDKIKVCFTILENPVAQTGSRTVYMRIAKPDNKIIAMGKEDIYTFNYQGQKMQFTLKKDFNYEGKTVNLCAYMDKPANEAEALKGGVYTVALFIDDYQIGEAQFSLK